MEIDYGYIASLIGMMSGVPVRVYEAGKLTVSYSLVRLVKDPVDTDYEAIKTKKNHIDYYINDDFLYYGIVNRGNVMMIIGPSRQSKMSKQELSDYAFKLGVPPEAKQEFLSSFDAISILPLSVILQMLCSINYLFNEEKLYVSDILAPGDMAFDPAEEAPIEEEEANHNTLLIEETIADMVKNGDVDSLKQWSKNAPSIRTGTLSNNQIRNLKNTFIVTATLVSRAAIQGGMSVNDAFSLSDRYIQKAELLNAYAAILNLQYRMVEDYAAHVRDINYSESKSRIANEVTNYVYHHISSPIKTQDIADALGVSRSYLSSEFAKTTGKALSDFVLEIKFKEAKKLLRNTNKSIEAISDYLGFSTQGNFARAFKAVSGRTPKEYRKRK
ncbi:MAG: helix-turn-helix domain-containing protein [Bacilli bacterium]|nr:helix-turn-helix domain-containing protein [Bacilli bacterium]